MKQTSTLKLKVVFTCSDLKSSSADVFELYSQLDALLDKFKGKSQLKTRELSIVNSDPIPQLAAHLRKLTKPRAARKKSK